jgi:hypothetical protein
MPKTINNLLDLSQSAKTLLASFVPASTIIFADMTGTILDQTPNGFPEEQRERIRGFLEQGGVIVLVTGDSYATVHTQFVKPLSYKGESPVFLVTGAGHRIDRLAEGVLTSIHLDKGFKEDTHRDLVRAVERLFVEYVEPGFKFSPAELELLLSPDGHRIDVGPALPALQNRCFVEVIPNKCTVFFPGGFQASGIGAAMLDRLAQDQEVLRLAAAEGAHVIRGGNFTDIILSSKEDGISSLYKHIPELRHLTETRNHLAIGD